MECRPQLPHPLPHSPDDIPSAAGETNNQPNKASMPARTTCSGINPIIEPLPSEEELRRRCELIQTTMARVDWIDELDQWYPEWYRAGLARRFVFIVADELGPAVARLYTDNLFDGAYRATGRAF